MKKIQAVENLLNNLTEHNFLNLYFIKDYDTNESLSICFLTRSEAVKHLTYLIKKEDIRKRKVIIAETCVYMG